MVIFVRDHLSGCNTNADGDVLFCLIVKALEDYGSVEVNFSAMTNATSSFVNSSFVPLLDTYSLPDLKSRVKVTRAHPQIADMIRSRLTFEDGRSAA